MPITSVNYTLRELTYMAPVSVCPEHPDKHLVVAWQGGEKPGEGHYVLRCPGGHDPDKVERRPSLTELYRRGVGLPIPIVNRIERRKHDRRTENREGG